jgi:ferredoxin-type protein NapH
MGRGKWKKRGFVQAAAAFLTNSHLSGFWEKKIYTGQGKRLCVPGMNCYSCPAASGACPIGALQAVEGSSRFRISFYVLGFLSILGALFGRFICGFLCVFGWIQDLLYMVPVHKATVPKRLDHFLRWLKYVILAVFVFGLPIFLRNDLGMSAPYFCKLICPVGTLEGGIPLVLMNRAMRSAAGFLFQWKMMILIVVVGLSMVVYRPFCKYICPLGAFYSLFNRISLIRLSFDEKRCTDCGACERTCKMNVRVREKPDSLECIRCGECAKVCPVHALHLGLKISPSSANSESVNPERKQIKCLQK